MIRLNAPQSPKGWTIVELMITVGMMGILLPTLTQLFTVSYQGLSEVEMHLQLKSTNETIALHLHEQINGSKHMYQNSAGSISIINKLSMTGAPAPATFSGSVSTYQLAQAQDGATISFNPASAVAAEFGNALFYAESDRNLIIKGVSYTAPITLSGASVTNAAGKAATINLDMYRFYFDYLSTAGDMKPIRDITSYWLIEWQSVQFVDAFEIDDLANADATGKLEQSVINNLVSRGITLAYDPTQAALTMGSPVTGYSFYTLSGTTMTAQTNLTIPMAGYTPLSRMSSGAIASFSYGIPGNYPALGSAPSAPKIPIYNPSSTVANAYPGGFEVGIIGTGGGMQVMTRCLLAAKGNNRSGILWDNTTTISSARDIW